MRRWAALAALALSGCQPAVTGPHDTVFVSDEKLDLLHLVDGATGEVTGTIRTGARPRALELSPDGKTLYVAAERLHRHDPRCRPSPLVEPTHPSIDGSDPRA